MPKNRINVTEIYSVILIEPKRDEIRRKYGKSLPHCQLIYKLSGEVITHFNGKTAKIAPGTVYILPKCDNADYYIERTEVGDCIDIYFDTDIPLTDELLCFNFSQNQKLSELFRKIYRIWSSKSDGYYYKAMSLIYEILYETVLKSLKSIPSSKYKKTENGIKYIREHMYSPDIDYYAPSKICSISYTYFKKLFIEQFGLSPVRYVTDKRLERGRELLLTDRYSVSEIAELCGFESVYYFSKKFKEKYQLSPTLYKKLTQSGEKPTDT